MSEATSGLLGNHLESVAEMPGSLSPVKPESWPEWISGRFALKCSGASMGTCSEPRSADCNYAETQTPAVNASSHE